MSDNLDISLQTLAREVNDLEAARTADSKYKMVSMGHKIIAIRELLREQNGEAKGSSDATGNRAPRGWKLWVKENLTITDNHARHCVQCAVDPEGTFEKRRKVNRTFHKGWKAPISFIRKNWHSWSDDDQQNFVDAFREIVRG